LIDGLLEGVETRLEIEASVWYLGFKESISETHSRIPLGGIFLRNCTPWKVFWFIVLEDTIRVRKHLGRITGKQFLKIMDKKVKNVVHCVANSVRVLFTGKI